MKTETSAAEQVTKNLNGPSRSLSIEGLGFTAISSIIWGLLPLYWKFCSSIPPLMILCHRIFWSFLLLMVVTGIKNGTKIFSAIKNPKLLRSLILSGVLLGVNWFIYIAAVNSSRIVESSLGYYMSPLFNIFLGIILLKEKLSRLQVISLILALTGVLYQIFSYGKFPFISISLMLTFCFYGLLKKTTALDSLSTLTVETLVLMPFAVSYLIYGGITGLPVFGNGSPSVITAIVLSGLATSLPLFLFSEGVKRLPYSAMAFLQYLTPSFMLLIGTLVYREPFTLTHLISFSCIWSALGIASYAMIKQAKKGPDPAGPVQPGAAS